MSSLLYRLATACARRRGLVLSVWLVLVAALGGTVLAIGSTTSSAVTIPGTESQRALDRLQQEFPQAAGTRGTIVFAAPKGQTILTPAAQQAVAEATAEAKKVPGVVAAVSPYESKALTPDGRYGLLTVSFSTGPDEITDAQRAAYAKVGWAAEKLGLTVERGGDVQVPTVDIGAGEAIGVAVALVVLVVTFGSLIAAGMTMLNALIGVGVGMSGLFLLSNVIEITNTAPILALMLGLAVGIDYSLFITSRHRAHLADGLEPWEAAARAVGTAGSAVLFAGLTVVIALACLSIVGIPFLTVMGLAAAGTVAIAVLIALTLLPAILTMIGHRIAPKARRSATPREGFGFRWARFLTRFRIPAILVALVGLGVVAIPALDLRLALPDGSSAPAGSDRRAAYDLIADGFGPGFNGQLSIVVFAGSAQQTQQVAAEVVKTLTGTAGTVAVVPGGFSASGQAGIIQVIPTTGPTTVATERLVGTIRAEVRPLAVDGVDIAVTGSTAVGIDVSEKLSAALPVYLLVVVGLSFLLLMLVFRSLLVPLKATLGFLLTIAATFGATVAVFQWGWLGSVFGLANSGPLVSFLPILLIGILFGLAMDYEVFLVSRMREDFVHGESAQAATVSGMGHGARVVTAAGIIMVSVFGGFVATDDSIIKSIGFALAFGVLVDAFVVRMTIVPAVMSLLGRSAWYLPRYLDKALPRVDIEGERLRRQFATEVPTNDPVSV